MTPSGGVVRSHHVCRLGHGQAATAHAQVQWRVNLSVVELHQHVCPDNAQLGRTEGHEGGHIEAAHADDVDILAVRGEAQLPGPGILEVGLRLDPGAAHDWHHLGKNTPLGQSQHEFIFRTQSLILIRGRRH